MASWITHLMVADIILGQLPYLDRKGFCVGNIAPDCNVENEDWTAFTPPREVTHWMGGERKTHSDCDRFFDEYVLARKNSVSSREELSFLLGYYCHLLTDAEHQKMIRDEKRVRDVWRRIKSDSTLCKRAIGFDETWDSAKKLITKERRMAEVYSMEAEYLQANPDSGYLTEILPLKEFPDYIDYMPSGCIVRKIGVMGFIPQPDESLAEPVAISAEELNSFVKRSAELFINKMRKLGESFLTYPQ